jgi:hypothetical protein
VHAWLIRRRLHEHDMLGDLLLSQREQRERSEQEASPRRRRHDEPEASALDLALAEHQASADEYEALTDTLDELVAHTGPQRALVEFHLWLGEHLAALSEDPDAANAGGLPTTLGQARWLGRAQAGLATRTRVEQVTVPTEDD